LRLVSVTHPRDPQRTQIRRQRWEINTVLHRCRAIPSENVSVSIASEVHRIMHAQIEGSGGRMERRANGLTRSCRRLPKPCLHLTKHSLDGHRRMF
jgi:hypothetical protein